MKAGGFLGFPQYELHMSFGRSMNSEFRLDPKATEAHRLGSQNNPCWLRQLEIFRHVHHHCIEANETQEWMD